MKSSVKNHSVILAEILEKTMLIDLNFLRRKDPSPIELPKDLANRPFKEAVLALDRVSTITSPSLLLLTFSSQSTFHAF